MLYLFNCLVGNAQTSDFTHDIDAAPARTT
jgi:hypothetical protein